MKQFMEFSEKTLEKLKIYEDVLKKWQSKINLVSNSTLSDVWDRHIMDSAQLYPLISKQEQVVLDLGSGAGFPGLVLAILNQYEGKGKWHIHLVESDIRKCVFMQEVVRLCQLNVKIHNCRIEQMPDMQADVITARALKETKTEVKSLFFGVNEKLDINVPESKVRDRNADVSLLYKVAKEFIYYVKGIKEA